MGRGHVYFVVAHCYNGLMELSPGDLSSNVLTVSAVLVQTFNVCSRIFECRFQ